MKTINASNQSVVMITGAAGGLGQELVQQFFSNGYKVFATARTLPQNQKSGVVWHQLDVSDYVQCKKAMAHGFNTFGRIDVLINNASSYIGGVTIAETNETDIDEALAVTLKAPIYLSKLYVELARSQRSGKIIFISSTAGLSGEPDCGLYSIYSAAKAGLIRFAECLNEDIQPLGMQAQVVVPCSMRAGLDESALVAEKAVAYDAVARFVFDIAKSDKNLSITKSILRPAQVPAVATGG